MQNKNYSLTTMVFNGVRSFTAQFDEIVKRILIDCMISPGEKPSHINQGKTYPIKTLWDTGCAGCLIKKDFAKKIGLVSHRKFNHY
jgi:hypothetical protein